MAAAATMSAIRCLGDLEVNAEPRYRMGMPGDGLTSSPLSFGGREVDHMLRWENFNAATTRSGAS